LRYGGAPDEDIERVLVSLQRTTREFCDMATEMTTAAT